LGLGLLDLLHGPCLHLRVGGTRGSPLMRTAARWCSVAPHAAGAIAIEHASGCPCLPAPNAPMPPAPRSPRPAPPTPPHPAAGSPWSTRASAPPRPPPPRPARPTRPARAAVSMPSIVTPPLARHRELSLLANKHCPARPTCVHRPCALPSQAAAPCPVWRAATLLEQQLARARGKPAWSQRGGACAATSPPSPPPRRHPRQQRHAAVHARQPDHLLLDPHHSCWLGRPADQVPGPGRRPGGVSQPLGAGEQQRVLLPRVSEATASRECQAFYQ
jgi:hypothetical protein